MHLNLAEISGILKKATLWSIVDMHILDVVSSGRG